MENNNKEISKYSRFKNSAVWKEIKEIFEKRIAILDKQINTIGQNEIKYTERDIAILTKQAIISLMEYPYKTIDDLMSTKKGSGEINEADPYEEGEEQEEEISEE